MGGKNPLCGKLRTSIKQLEDNGSQIGTHEFHMHVYGVFDAKVSVFQKLVPAMSKIQRRAARVLPKQGVGSVVSSLASRRGLSSWRAANASVNSGRTARNHQQEPGCLRVAPCSCS